MVAVNATNLKKAHALIESHHRCGIDAEQPQANGAPATSLVAWQSLGICWEKKSTEIGRISTTTIDQFCVETESLF
jgi:hypothetical protein